MNPKKWRQFFQPQKNDANLEKPKKWHFHKFQTQTNDTSIPIKIFTSAPPGVAHQLWRDSCSLFAIHSSSSGVNEASILKQKSRNEPSVVPKLPKTVICRVKQSNEMFWIASQRKPPRYVS